MMLNEVYVRKSYQVTTQVQQTSEYIREIMSAQLLDMFDHSHPGAFLHDKDMSLKSFETIPRRSPQDHDL